MNFLKFKQAVNRQLDIMSAHELFYVEGDKNMLWDLYLSSFKKGTNPMYKERTEHDCNCCKQFIRNIGNVVAIVDGSLVSVWDVVVEDDFQVVADAMSAKIKSMPLAGVYKSETSHIGVNRNHSLAEDGTIIQWDHFYHKLDSRFVMNQNDIPTFKGNVNTNKQVLQRSLEEITVESLDIVIELIDQNSLYRGQEHKNTVKTLQQVKRSYNKLEDDTTKDFFLWQKSLELGGASKFRNTVIGTLLCDISDGVELEVAVKKFEDKVAPHNYKRPSALITKGMIAKAENKVAELGIEDSLYRRYAVTEDVTINNVLFADRSAKKVMGVFDQIQDQVKDKVPSLDKVQEVNVKDFIENVLPNANSLEIMVENKHINNFVSLIAPVNKDAKNILKWNNNFSWSYNGEVTDSIKDRVKQAGGNVTGDLRCSLSWFNPDDLDIHIIEPRGNRISFNIKHNHVTGGRLDVDMNAGGNNNSANPVENITWPSKCNMQEGNYQLIVNNYNKRLNDREGFVVEVEFGGAIHTFNYDKSVRNKENVEVATFSYSHADGLKITKSIPSTQTSKEVWSINTCKYQKVSMVMDSPNHWDDMKIGNKHLFFVLEGCNNPDKSRGLYNEFLTHELTEHRKVFEVLGSKMKTEESDNQLSGLGFSSTQQNSVLCKVGGNFSRLIKINF